MMRKLRHRIEDERSTGRALLVASHVMSFVERISNRVGIMRRGKLVAEAPPADLRAQAGMNDLPFEDVFFHFAG
jgi:ABC-2 type transport system ATP-binding protein